MSEPAIWKALADPTRRALLDLLRDRPRTTGELCEQFAMSRFGVMRHLDVLAEAGLLVVERRGRQRWNHLNAGPLRRELERWLASYAGRLAQTAAALARHSETGGDDMAVPGTTLAFGEIDVLTELRVAAPRDRVYASLLRMGDWWPHRFREGSSVGLEPRLGGRFFEDWGGGDGALYGTVTALVRDTMLTITGPMGMRGPVVSVWTITLSDDGDGTLVHGTHKAQGDIDGATQAAYREGWSGVYEALRADLAVN